MRAVAAQLSRRCSTLCICLGISLGNCLLITRLPSAQHRLPHPSLVPTHPLLAPPRPCPPAPPAVLRRQNSYFKSLWMLPLFAFLTVWIGVFYIIQKGPKLSDKISTNTNLWISSCCGEAPAGWLRSVFCRAFFCDVTPRVLRNAHAGAPTDFPRSPPTLQLPAPVCSPA